MASFVVFLIFVSLLVLAVFAALGAWLAGEKGQSTIKGALFGAFGNIIGLLIIATWKASDEELAKELYDRKLITKDELDKTIELSVKKK